MSFVNSSTLQGATYGVTRCQTTIKQVTVVPLLPLFLAILLYVDDVLPILSLSDLPLNLIILLFQLLLLILHKIGLKISEKIPLQITRTPKYLGFIFSFPKSEYYPQQKQLRKLGYKILQILNPKHKTTFRDILSLKGLSNFIFKSYGSTIFQPVDTYIKIYIKTKDHDIRTILKNPIPLSKILLNIIQQIISQLASLEKITFKALNLSVPTQYHLKLVTDAGPIKYGAWAIFNNTILIDDKTYLEFSINSQKVSTTYTQILWMALKFSSTDHERKALIVFIQKIIVPFLTHQAIDRSKITVSVFVDNQPLIFHLKNQKNPHPRARNEIQLISTLLKKFTITQKFFWQSRNKASTKIADSNTRDIEMSLTKTRLYDLMSHFELQNIEIPLTQAQMRELNRFSPPYTHNIPIYEDTANIFFPSLNTPHKQIFEIIEFFKFRHLEGILILPKIHTFKNLIEIIGIGYYFPIGDINSNNFINIPQTKKIKKLPMIALNFDFT